MAAASAPIILRALPVKVAGQSPAMLHASRQPSCLGFAPSLLDFSTVMTGGLATLN